MNLPDQEFLISKALYNNVKVLAIYMYNLYEFIETGVDPTRHNGVALNNIYGLVCVIYCDSNKNPCTRRVLKGSS